MLKYGVWSDAEILEGYKNGQVIIDPFIEENVKGSSVDVRVGHYYYRTEARNMGQVYNPLDAKSIKRYFGEVQEATSHEEYIEDHGLQPFANIPLEHPIIVLEAGQRILAHTIEFIGVLGNATTMMKARSSTGRNGFSVCHDAGWGDPGYINRWTMEVQNINKNHPMVLPVGLRIAQLVFLHTGKVNNPYRSKYQDINLDASPAEILAEAQKLWTPEQMLPRTYKDNAGELPLIPGMNGGYK